MTQLIPEQRVDKNGKLVVRHVKSGGSGALPCSAFPAPSIVVQEESVTDVLRREFSTCGMSDSEVNDYAVEFLKDKGETTKKVVADALLNRRSDDDFRAIKHVLTVSMEAGVIQLAVSDINFMLKVTECMPPSGMISPLRSSYNIIEDTFRNTFRTRKRNEDEADYLKHADAFRAMVVARVLGITENVESTFDEREQHDHIMENFDEFVENLSDCKEASDALNQCGLRPDSHMLLSVCRLVKECNSTMDVVLASVIERQRCDEDEIKTILGTTPALSQGAI